MYISTSHRIGDTVYYYSAADDTVTRAKVVQISYLKSEDGEDVSYRISAKGFDDFLRATDDQLYSRPESAFYSNPLPVPEPEAVST